MTHSSNLRSRRLLATALLKTLRLPVVGIAIGLSLSSGAFAQFGGTGTGGNSLGGMGSLTGGLSQLGGMSGLGGTGSSGMGGMSGSGGMGGMSGSTSLGGGMSSAQALNFGGASAGNAANPFGSAGMNSVLGGAVGSVTNSAIGAAALNRTMGGMNGMNMGGMGRNQRGSQNGQQSDKRKIRATVKLGFEAPQVTNVARSQAISSRLMRVPSVAAEGVTVEVVGRQAVIRGQAATADDGKLIERLLALEPGIDGVKNELTYASGEPNPPVAEAQANAATDSAAVVPAAEPEIVPKP